MQQTVSARISGKVQGVWFRASTKEMADELEIKGIVRNEDGGTVYVEAQGEKEALNVFLDWLNEGPVHARVDKVEIEEIDHRDFTDFRITR